MSIKRIRSNSKTKSMSPAPTPVQRVALFGPPPLLGDEDAAAYDVIVARIHAAVKPLDIIDEMLVADVVSLQWEVLRWRRVKLNVIRAHARRALESELIELLDYDHYRNVFEERLADILRDYLEDDQTQKLMRGYAQEERDAIEQVERVITNAQLDMDNLDHRAKVARAEELAQQYARREPDAIELVTKLLASNGQTIDDVITIAIAFNDPIDCLTTIERIDRLATAAETRRDASLREIDRRRAVLAEALRQNLQEVEDAEFEVVERTSTKAKSAA